jgi:hypothetical protein
MCGVGSGRSSATDLEPKTGPWPTVGFCVYAALARRSSTRDSRRSPGSSGCAAGTPRLRDELAGRLIRRAALQSCLPEGVLMAGPAPFSGRCLGADLAWQVVILNRLVISLSALYRRKPSRRRMSESPRPAPPSGRSLPAGSSDCCGILPAGSSARAARRSAGGVLGYGRDGDRPLAKTPFVDSADGRHAGRRRRPDRVRSGGGAAGRGQRVVGVEPRRARGEPCEAAAGDAHSAGRGARPSLP